MQLQLSPLLETDFRAVPRSVGIARHPGYSHGARVRVAEYRPLCGQAGGPESWYALALGSDGYVKGARARLCYV